MNKSLQNTAKSRLWKKKVFVILAPLLFWLLIFFVGLEKYFPPYPLIDTKLAEGFSPENFSKIKAGQTKTSVEKLIGVGSSNGPFPMTVTHPFAPEGEKECYSYSSDGRIEPFLDFAWIAYGVCYDKKGLVTRKYEEIVNN